MNHRLPFTSLLGLAALLSGCVASQPRNTANICEIFEDRRSWYKAAMQAEQSWGIPAPVNMAFIYQESGFNARAKPARGKFLWVFPGSRPSSAYGYAQAIDSTWDEYMVQSGNWDARRDKFADAIDFVGWYNAMSRRINQIPPSDAAHLYFAYHEGNAGYARGTYREKSWLLDTGFKVQANAERFNEQFSSCQSELDKNWFQRLLS